MCEAKLNVMSSNRGGKSGKLFFPRKSNGWVLDNSHLLFVYILGPLSALLGGIDRDRSPTLNGRTRGGSSLAETGDAVN